MKPRKLLASEVTFTVELEPEDLQVTGHFKSGDPDYEEEESELEARIIAESDAGNVEAWCSIKVTASWNGYKGHDYLGACSFLDDGTHRPVSGQVAECVEDHDMKAQALDDLNKTIAVAYDKLEPLLRPNP